MTAATPGLRRRALGDPDPARLAATVGELAGDRYGGRRVGTVGGRAAGAWLAEQLRALGATVRTQELPVPGVRDLYATPVLRWRGEGSRHRRDFVEHLASADLPGHRTGTLAIDGEPMRGRWVVASTVEPALVCRAVAEEALGLLIPRGTDADGWMPKC